MKADLPYDVVSIEARSLVGLVLLESLGLVAKVFDEVSNVLVVVA